MAICERSLKYEGGFWGHCPKTHAGRVIWLTNPDWKSIALQQTERLQALEKNAAKSAVESALVAALNPLPLHDAGRGQLVELLRDQVVLTQDSTGKTHATGPNMTPLSEHCKTILGREEYAHFRRPPDRSGAASYQPAGPAGPAPQFRPGEAVQLHNEGRLPLGRAIIEEARALAADLEASGMNDPTKNLQLPMGIYPKM